VNLNAGTSSSRVQIGTVRHVRIWNSGNATVYVQFGGATVTASTSTSMPIPAGNTELFSCPYPYIAAITASGSSTIYITPGAGL
jgi:hypothetical protein